MNHFGCFLATSGSTGQASISYLQKKWEPTNRNCVWNTQLTGAFLGLLNYVRKQGWRSTDEYFIDLCASDVRYNVGEANYSLCAAGKCLSHKQCFYEYVDGHYVINPFKTALIPSHLCRMQARSYCPHVSWVLWISMTVSFVFPTL